MHGNVNVIDEGYWDCTLPDGPLGLPGRDAVSAESNRNIHDEPKDIPRNTHGHLCAQSSALRSLIVRRLTPSQAVAAGVVHELEYLGLFVAAEAETWGVVHDPRDECLCGWNE